MFDQKQFGKRKKVDYLDVKSKTPRYDAVESSISIHNYPDVTETESALFEHLGMR